MLQLLIKLILMKSLVILFFLLLATTSYSQTFELGTYTSQGIIVGKDLQADLFQAQITVEPKLVIDNFTSSAVTMSYTNNTQTGFIAGPRVGYKVYKSEDELNELEINGQALFGNTGKQLFGGGLSYSVDRLIINGNANYETQGEQMWFDLGVGYKIIQ